MNNITAQTGERQADQICQAEEGTAYPQQAEDVLPPPEWFMVRVTSPGEPGVPESYHLDELRAWPSIVPFIQAAEMEHKPFIGCTLILDQGSEEDVEKQGPTILFVYVDE